MTFIQSYSHVAGMSGRLSYYHDMTHLGHLVPIVDNARNASIILVYFIGIHLFLFLIGFREIEIGPNSKDFINRIFFRTVCVSLENVGFSF